MKSVLKSCPKQSGTLTKYPHSKQSTTTGNLILQDITHLSLEVNNDVCKLSSLQFKIIHGIKKVFPQFELWTTLFSRKKLHWNWTFLHAHFLTLAWHFQQTLRCSAGLGQVEKSSPAKPCKLSPSAPAVCPSLSSAGYLLRCRKLFQELLIPRAALPRGGKVVPVVEVALGYPLPSVRMIRGLNRPR